MNSRQMYIATALAIVALCATFVSSAAALPHVYVADTNRDDIIVTKDGPVNLMETTPVEPGEIEELMNS